MIVYWYYLMQCVCTGYIRRLLDTLPLYLYYELLIPLKSLKALRFCGQCTTGINKRVSDNITQCSIATAFAME